MPFSNDQSKIDEQIRVTLPGIIEEAFLRETTFARDFSVRTLPSLVGKEQLRAITARVVARTTKVHSPNNVGSNIEGATVTYNAATAKVAYLFNQVSESRIGASTNGDDEVLGLVDITRTVMTIMAAEIDKLVYRGFTQPIDQVNIPGLTAFETGAASNQITQYDSAGVQLSSGTITADQFLGAIRQAKVAMTAATSSTGVVNPNIMLVPPEVADNLGVLFSNFAFTIQQGVTALSNMQIRIVPRLAGQRAVFLVDNNPAYMEIVMGAEPQALPSVPEQMDNVVYLWSCTAGLVVKYAKAITKIIWNA